MGLPVPPPPSHLALSYRSFSHRCEDRLGGERIEMVWALVYKMPEQNQLEQEQGEKEDDDGDGDEDEDDVNEDDLDGDGDVAVAGTPQTASGRLRIPHEAWVACERILESGLVLQHVIPIDQRFLVRGMLPAYLPTAVCHAICSAPRPAACLPKRDVDACRAFGRGFD